LQALFPAALVLTAAPALAQMSDQDMADHLSHQHMADHYDHPFHDAEAWAKTFDDPARDRWQQPDKVIAALKLAAASTVADIGSGTGYFSVRLGRALPQGRVIGVDIEPDMVRYLNERAGRENLANVTSVLGTPDDPKLAAGSVDLALVVDTYHHIGKREAYFGKVLEAVKPGGRLVIIDFRADTPLGPPRHFRVPVDQVKGELAHAGFRFVEADDILADQYILVFQRPNG
jgi:SAM-dependent methyltransferase